MNITYMIIAVVLVLVVLAAILGPIFARRKRSERYHDQYGSEEYDRTVQTTGTEKKAQTELDKRRKHVDTLTIRPLTSKEREQYLADWAAVQSKFVDDPGQATVEADHLIMEVMQLRNYPVSDFEERAADISVDYPSLVSNYRAAREIAILNKQHHAGTEDLRRAMIYYRSLFDELLGKEANEETAPVGEKSQ